MGLGIFFACLYRVRNTQWQHHILLSCQSLNFTQMLAILDDLVANSPQVLAPLAERHLVCSDVFINFSGLPTATVVVGCTRRCCWLLTLLIAALSGELQDGRIEIRF